MFKITILGEQEHSVKSADRTKAVQVWCWGNMYLPKSGKWPSQHLYLKKNSAFHARKNPKQQYLNVVMLNDVSFSKKRIYLCLKPCSLNNTLLTYWIFPRFASNWHKRVHGSSTLTVWHYHLTHEILIFVKILFNFKKKSQLEYCKRKPF